MEGSEEAAVWYRSSPGQRADVEAERKQRVLMLERTGYEVDRLEEPPKVMKKRDRLSRKENFSFFHLHMQNDNYALTFAFIASWVASLTRSCSLVCIVMLWAGAMTLSLGVEQKEKCIAR